MSGERIEQLVRAANPVPDVAALDGSVSQRGSLGTRRAKIDDGVMTDDPADGMHTSDQRHPRRRWWLVAAASIVVLALGLLAVAAVEDADTVQTDTVAPSSLPTSQTTARSVFVGSLPETSSSSPAAPGNPEGSAASGGMWPQSSFDAVRQAQAFADAGDPAYTWQVDPQLLSPDGEAYFGNPEADIVERFLRERLGWDAFTLSPYDANDSHEGFIDGVTYIRCATDEPNSLYPAEACGPTIDELRYETVSIDLAQVDQRGPTGIWVVSEWRMVDPDMQTDPRVAEAEATERLQSFLAARVAGEGAERHVEFAGYQTTDRDPLLYTTTTGAAYERYEIERVGEATWPYGHMLFEIRLFAEGGATVVEQQVFWDGVRLIQSATETTENGQPVPVRYDFYDGTVSLSAASPWGDLVEEEGLSLDRETRDERLELTARPIPIATNCTQGPTPDDADALARSIQSDPGLDVTSPVPVRVGGVAGVQMDVTIAVGASLCDASGIAQVLTPRDGNGRNGIALEQGSRMRLYLLDIHQRYADWIMAVAVVAPEARFNQMIESAAPIMESIQFHGA